MQLECSKEKIRSAVALVEKMTGKNLSLPVLSGILFIAKGKTLKMRATNLDLGIEVEIPAKIEKEGVAVIPGSVLSNLIGTFFEETIFFDLQNENLVVETKNSKTTIKSFSSEDFPTLPTISSKKESFEIEAEKIVSGLRSVWYSAAISDIKPEIASVYVYGESREIIFAATDSFRLAEKKIEHVSGKNITPVIIPIKNISEIIRTLETITGNILVSFNKSQISFEGPSFFLTSRLIDGIFPDYKQIIPKNFTTEAVVLKQDFINSLRATNIFRDKLNQITVIIDPQGKKMELRSKNPDVGENVVRIDSALRGEKIKLNFNHKYISEGIQSIEKDSISLQLNGESRPMVVQGIGDKSFTYLVMPLNQ